MAESLFDEFEAYSENRMLPLQLKTFEERLLQDSDLRSALADYQQFRHGIDAVKMQQQLEKIHTRLDQQGDLDRMASAPTVTQPRPLWTRLAIAAIVLLVSGYGLFWATRPTLAEQTFLTYYRTELVARGITTCGPQLALGLQLYRSGRFSQALVAFNQLPASQPCVHYYTGLTQLALTNIAAAITELEKAIEQARRTTNADTSRLDVPNMIALKAEWYLALAYLKVNRTADARNQLTAIASQNDNPFQHIAKKALADLQHD